MFETSTIELSASAFRNNLKFIRKKLKKGVRLCSVVKGNAYGHGLKEFVSMAMQEGVDYFAVHSAEEAYCLQNSLSTMPHLFIMGEIEGQAIEWAIQHQIEFAVFDEQRLETALKFAQKLNIKAKIHIEVETGMRRTGFEIDQLSALCDWFRAHESHVIFQGLFTHFAGAESQANHFRISKQIEVFHQAKLILAQEQLKPIYVHAACSAAMLNYPETQENMVRVGILNYGFWPNVETQIRASGENNQASNPLKRVIRWSAKIMTTKNISKGHFVGYGTTFLAHKNMKLAIVPVGYSHGYSRNLSNVASVLVNGKVAPVVGTVNMNSLTIDISLVGKVEKGDEVVLIGKQNGKQITASSFSEQSQQLNYELLTRLPMNIPRFIKS